MNFLPKQNFGNIQRQFPHDQNLENVNHHQNPVHQPYFASQDPATYTRPLSNGIVQQHGNFHSHSVNVGCPPPTFSADSGQQSSFIQPHATSVNRQQPSPALNIAIQQPPQFQQGPVANSSHQVPMLSNPIHQPSLFQHGPMIVNSGQPPPNFQKGPPLANSSQQIPHFEQALANSSQQTPYFQQSAPLASSGQLAPNFQGPPLANSSQLTPSFQQGPPVANSSQQAHFQHGPPLANSSQQVHFQQGPPLANPSQQIPHFQQGLPLANSSQQTPQFQHGPMLSNAIQQPSQVQQPIPANQQFYHQPTLSNNLQPNVVPHISSQGPQVSLLSVGNNILSNPGQLNFQQSATALNNSRQQSYFQQRSEFNNLDNNRFQQNQYKKTELISNQQAIIANDRQPPLIQPSTGLSVRMQPHFQHMPPMNTEQQFSHNASINNQSLFQPRPRLTNFQQSKSPQRPMMNNFSNPKSPHRSTFDNSKTDSRHINTAGQLNVFSQSNSITGKGEFRSPIKYMDKMRNSSLGLQNNFQERQAKSSFVENYTNNNQDSTKPWIQFSKAYVNNANKFNNGFTHNNNTYENKRNNSWNTYKPKGNQKRGKDNIEMPFSCDTCDRAFVVEADLKKHLEEHVQCKINGCQFEAHFKVVALHQKMQHDTGYADEISKLDNAEEIEKWRNARRSRFPTAENVKKRKAEQVEREARGEVLETKDFGKFKRSKTDNYNDNRRGRGRNARGGFNNRRRREFKPRNPDSTRMPLTVVIDDSDSDDDSHIKLPKFKGLLYTVKNAIESADATDLNTTETAESAISEDSEVLSSIVETLLLEVCSNCPSFDCQENRSSNHEINNASVLMCEGDPASSPRSDEPPVVVLDSEDEVIKISDSDEASGVHVENEAIYQIVNYKDTDDSDDEPPNVEPIYKCALNGDAGAETEDVKSPNKEHPQVEGIPNSDDDDAPVEEPIIKSNLNEVTVPEAKLDKSPKEQGKTENDQKEKSEESGQSFKNTRKFQRRTANQRQFNRPYPPPKPTLLEKLLADDIRHERNVILQCVRHIVKNDFFDK